MWPKRKTRKAKAVWLRLAIWLALGLAIPSVIAGGCGAGGDDIVSKADTSIGTRPAHHSMATEVLRVPSEAMEPTLRLGDRVLLTEHAPKVGDIVAYYPPEGAGVMRCGPSPHSVKPGGAACDAPIPEKARIKLVSRVVAGPGDEIYIREGRVYRKAVGSSRGVAESHVHVRACGANPECNFPDPIRIPAGHWFLMGDNRGASNDSRFWGPVPAAWIVGVVTGTLPRVSRRAERAGRG
jgi:signal peptidase I